MTLLYFAWVRQKIGVGEEICVLPAGVRTIGELVAHLAARGGGYADVFADLKRLRAARNQEHVGFDCEIAESDEIAFFSPGNGRMSIVRIQAEDFDAGTEIAALSAGRSDVGAVASFTGVVRGDEGLTALVLEHYPKMTEAEIGRIVAEAETRWPLKGVTIIHRIGRLAVGERVVLVAVASGHRGAAFEACEFLMDYLKTRAPFWKQEERVGKAAWVEAKSSDDEQAARWRR